MTLEEGLGTKKTLMVVKEVEFGVYLGNSQEKVLLPKKQVPEGVEVGDPIEVFLYKDSSDRLIATTNEPKIMLGELAVLNVAATGGIGAFLDWGLEKDLFLPYREQTTQVKAGDEVIAALYLDKSERLCATMKVYPYLQKESPYQKDDVVTGMVYEISHNFGAFVAVDDKYSALIPKKELYGELHVLQQISARVTGVKEDGKLDLGIRQKAHLQMSEDADKVLSLLREKKGFLPLHDKSSPEQIRETIGMSKNEFKRAIGHLYKEHLITLESDGIRLKK